MYTYPLRYIHALHSQTNTYIHMHIMHKFTITQIHICIHMNTQRQHTYTIKSKQNWFISFSYEIQKSNGKHIKLV